MSPNPTTDYVQIQWPIGIQKAKLSILDIGGRYLRTDEVITEDDLTINLNDLVNGTYLVKLETEKGVYLSQLIKN